MRLKFKLEPEPEPEPEPGQSDGSGSETLGTTVIVLAKFQLLSGNIWQELALEPEPK